MVIAARRYTETEIRLHPESVQAVYREPQYQTPETTVETYRVRSDVYVVTTL